MTLAALEIFFSVTFIEFSKDGFLLIVVITFLEGLLRIESDSHPQLSLGFSGCNKEC